MPSSPARTCPTHAGDVRPWPTYRGGEEFLALCRSLATSQAEQRLHSQLLWTSISAVEARLQKLQGQDEEINSDQTKERAKMLSELHTRMAAADEASVNMRHVAHESEMRCISALKEEPPEAKDKVDVDLFDVFSDVMNEQEPYKDETVQLSGVNVEIAEPSGVAAPTKKLRPQRSRSRSSEPEPSGVASKKLRPQRSRSRCSESQSEEPVSPAILVTKKRSKTSGISGTSPDPLQEDKSVGDESFAAAILSNSQGRPSAHSLARVSSQDMTWLAKVRRLAQTVVWSPFFEPVVTAVIVLNAFTIGLELESRATGKFPQLAAAASGSEHLFLSLYIAELVCRFLAFGLRACLTDKMVVFDLLLVIGGCITEWIVVPLASVAAMDEERHLPGSQFSLLRILRLFRSLRVARLCTLFHTLNRVVMSMLSSLDTLIAALMLAVIMIYIAACIALEIFTFNDWLREDPEMEELVELHFPTLPDSMISLMAFLNFDSMATIYKPLIEKRWYFMLYFFPLILVLTVCLMNILTALLVETSMSRSASDKKMQEMLLMEKCREVVPEMRAMFRNLDANQDGTLSADEARRCLSDSSMPELVRQRISPAQFEALFESLDNDGGGTVSEEEFITGLGHLMTCEDNMEVTEIKTLVRLLSRKVAKIEQRIP